MARRSTLVIALGAVILFAGCSTHYRNRVHPEYGQTEFDKDWYECRRENSHPAATVAGAYGSAGTVVSEDMAMACFRARGWYETDK
jgi:hypothetical protein